MTMFDYTSLSDLELILERDRLREQLEVLTVDPARSPAVCQMLANIDQQIDRMTDELTGRALSRHPTSPGPKFPPALPISRQVAGLRSRTDQTFESKGIVKAASDDIVTPSTPA